MVEEKTDSRTMILQKRITMTKLLKGHPEAFTIIAFVVLCVFMSIISDSFFSVSNINNILRQVSVNAIISVGMTMVILTGGIDLSVGPVMALSSTFMAGAMLKGIPIFPSVLIGLATGLVFGLFNGLLISYVKQPAFIVTLAMMEIARGIALLYTGGYPLSGLPASFGFVGKGRIIGIQVPVLIMLVTYVVAFLVLNRFVFGRYVYAIGGNLEATRLSGIQVKKYMMLVYVISGFTAALSSVILTSRLMSGQPNAGSGFELDAIAAVVLGGTDMSGGRGHILGTLLGVLMLGVLNNGLNLMGVSPYMQRVVKGIIILAAIYISSNKEKK
ncbi:MAG: ABC transporter permease [Sphaerochaetaceae bacterium]|jgi:ribose transport system permease protein